ncbi:MAG: PH domain-containing protein [Corynebacterium sp.]|uniref:PH domain-containing protein n=1 Tax=Corynebacterium sp. TaxID=1720 RepID=UPI0026DACBFF|nr:PH domain-containing protein [Corynebacterium sp.]MDO4762632.1 PH domain-containing protein [Corynebacterium sp.]
MSDTPYHRVHPLTPALKTWSVLFALAVFATTTFSDYTVELIRRLVSSDRGETLQAAGIITCILFVFVFASLLWWRAISYSVTDTEVTYRWGLFDKKVRSARLDRTQAIDVYQPFHARLFGLASVRIETAGGHNSRVEICYLRRSVAYRLKEQLLGKEEQGTLLVPPIPVHRTLLSSFLSIPALFTIVTTAATVAADISVAALIPLFFATVPPIWRTIDGSYQFTARRVGNTVTVSYGLANLQRKVLDMDRTHAVIVRRPALWRPFNWWRVRVSVAGYGEGTQGMTVLPVGDRKTAMMLVDLLMGVEVDPLNIPENMRYRSPRQARWVSPLDWRKQACELSEHFGVEYRGRVGRRVAVAHRRHIQEIGMRTGPIQRLVGVATVQMHLVHGPVTMTGRDLALDDAHTLLAELQR